MICTDIPYGDEFVPQVSELAAFASRVLVPGGLFVTHCGQYWLPESSRNLPPRCVTDG